MRQIVADVAGLAEPANAMASKAIVPQGLESSTLSPCTSRETQNLASIVPAYVSVAEGTDLTAFCNRSLFLYAVIRIRILFSVWQESVADQPLRLAQFTSESNHMEAA